MKPTQHKGILSNVVILMSLMIVPMTFFDLPVPNSQPQ
ncbi:putative membrane protein [Acinetobacter sp. 1281984]|nr:putative membrane protein [Acinetobacter sp. 1281984]